MGTSSHASLQAETLALEALRAATRSPLRNENLAHAQISDALQYAGVPECEQPGSHLEAWIYALALVYTHQTGLLPGFSNCENETRFERFVLALPTPPRFQLTRNRLKSIIRRLDLKNNPGFVQDVDALNNQPPISVT